MREMQRFLLTPLREGRLPAALRAVLKSVFLLTPLREGRPAADRFPSAWPLYFYSRPCGRGDRRCRSGLAWRKISTHAPAGGATVLRPHHWFLHWLFLLTPLREGRRDCCHDLTNIEAISTHAPAGGATSGSLLCACLCSNFYSRPCGRGDPRPIFLFPRLCISTHAPAGGATGVWRSAKRIWQISTHAPAGGATDIFRKMVRDLYDFYSRPCGRGDISRLVELAEADKISTHAPAGGATRGEDGWRERRCISTHAPAGGATAWTAKTDWAVTISTHAPAGGATLAQAAKCSVWIISTHAPAGGATLQRWKSSRPARYFYSRPCGRGDPHPLHIRLRPVGISTHAPAGGATGVV